MQQTLLNGFNGLASGTVMICFTALGLITWQVGDLQLVQLCVLMVVVTCGFFIVNFPFGKIFMGDGGAFLLGFMLHCAGYLHAWSQVLLFGSTIVSIFLLQHGLVVLLFMQ